MISNFYFIELFFWKMVGPSQDYNLDFSLNDSIHAKLEEVENGKAMHSPEPNQFSKKKRKLIFVVWRFFDRVKVKDAVGNLEIKAKCKYCKEQYNCKFNATLTDT